MAEREGKATSAKSYKGVLLSTGSDMGGRKKDTSLTTNRISFSSYGVDDSWYGRSTKEGRILAPTTTERAKKVIEGQRVYESPYGSVYSKSPSSGGLGLGKWSHKKSKLIASGQAQLVLESNHTKLGSDKAQTKEASWVPLHEKARVCTHQLREWVPFNSGFCWAWAKQLSHTEF